MVTIIAVLLISIFSLLASIHFYWAFGGKRWNDSVIPTKKNNAQARMPGIITTLIVAFGLLGFGLVVLLNIIDFKRSLLLESVQLYGLWLIASIFILRAIGEFKYIGFFKKIDQTKFGKNDTRYYSPLCLLIGLLAILLKLLT
ncbi:DUF3995 domain-containing protein [Flavobacterium sp. I3-2]|uniref:DUF3995 domain-containing protein n=1 Tax=Flavobacterium sp. I3-2 TaxID=2748319 RepID=UPI0015AE7A83|nr:DUF3995 domain-containing protein [Flavobacterium sp. I3-2]